MTSYDVRYITSKLQPPLPCLCRTPDASFDAYVCVRGGGLYLRVRYGIHAISAFGVVIFFLLYGYFFIRMLKIAPSSQQFCF